MRRRADSAGNIVTVGGSGSSRVDDRPSVSVAMTYADAPRWRLHGSWFAASAPRMANDRAAVGGNVHVLDVVEAPAVMREVMLVSAALGEAAARL